MIGDQITDIRIDLESLKPDDAKKLLEVLAPYPIKLTVKNSAQFGVTTKTPNVAAETKFDNTALEPTLKSKNLKGSAGADFKFGIPNFTAKGNLSKKEHNDKPSSKDNIDLNTDINPYDNSYRMQTKVEGDFDADLSNVKGDMNKNMRSGSGDDNFKIGLPTFNLGGNRAQEDLSASASLDLPSLRSGANANLSGDEINTEIPVFGIKGKSPKIQGDLNAGVMKGPGVQSGISGPDASAPIHKGLEMGVDVPRIKSRASKPSKSLSGSMDLGQTADYTAPGLKVHSGSGSTIGDKIRNFFHIKKRKSEKYEVQGAAGVSGTVNMKPSISSDAIAADSNRKGRKKGDRPHSIGPGTELQLGKQNVELRYVSPKAGFDDVPGDIDFNFAPPSAEIKSSRQEGRTQRYSADILAGQNTSGKVSSSYTSQSHADAGKPWSLSEGKGFATSYNAGIGTDFDSAHREAAVDVPSSYVAGGVHSSATASYSSRLDPKPGAVHMKVGSGNTGETKKIKSEGGLRMKSEFQPSGSVQVTPGGIDLNSERTQSQLHDKKKRSTHSDA